MALLLVSDSSVLIDLERGGLLEATFLSGQTLLVPDLLFEKELKDYNGSYLRGLGLAVTELSSQELSIAQDIQSDRPGISLEDCFALVCAHRPNHCLLAGDGLLRKVAATRNVTCRGLLWLMDEMLATGKVSKSQLYEGISRISQHAKCRLPKAEIEKRKKLWRDDPI